MTARTALAAPVPRWLVALVSLAAAGGVAWGAASTKTAALDSRVTKLETTQAADHDLLQHVDQHLADLSGAVREAIAHLPRR